MKKILVILFILCLVPTMALAVDLTGHEYIDGTWMKDPVLTEYGYVPKCSIVKMMVTPDGTLYQPDPCTEDPWGADYAPWGGSGGDGGVGE